MPLMLGEKTSQGLHVLRRAAVGIIFNLSGVLLM